MTNFFFSFFFLQLFSRGCTYIYICVELLRTNNRFGQILARRRALPNLLKHPPIRFPFQLSTSTSIYHLEPQTTDQRPFHRPRHLYDLRYQGFLSRLTCEFGNNLALFTVPTVPTVHTATAAATAEQRIHLPRHPSRRGGPHAPCRFRLDVAHARSTGRKGRYHRGAAVAVGAKQLEGRRRVRTIM